MLWILTMFDPGFKQGLKQPVHQQSIAGAVATEGTRTDTLTIFK
jgi:hypothetical protein